MYLMIASVRSTSLWGTDALAVTVEADVHKGMPSFSIVGLPDNAVKESRDRVRSAIANSGMGALFPPGTVHLPEGIDSEWIRQLTAEQLVTVKTKRGFSKLEWQKLRERNEALDCRVYARAAAWIVGIDRFSQRRWEELEKAVALIEAEPASQVDFRRTVSKAPQQRRVIRSSYL